MTDNARARWQSAALIAFTTLLLWGCGGSPARQEPEAPEPEPEAPQAVEIPDPFTLPPSAFAGVFSRAESQLARYDWMGASVALDSLPAESLTATDVYYLDYLTARIDFIRGDTAGAMARLAHTPVAGAATAATDPALRYRSLSFRHHMLELSGQYLAAAQTADAIAAALPQEYRRPWYRKLWHHLQRTDNAALQAARGADAAPQWQAWLELALISREQGALRTAELARWQTDNPGHPVAMDLPGGLDFLVQPLPAPRRVALLLPLSGRLAPAGQAVLDGYIAAHFKAGESGVQPELLVLDTTSYPATTDAYNAALAQGAQFVVGPLHKEGVADLMTYPGRPVPVLALNRVSAADAALSAPPPDITSAPDAILPAGQSAMPASNAALVQASLSPEDEARQLARLAYGRGARSALVVRPAGDWGVKVEKALADQWRQLGGRLADAAVYSTQESYSESLTGALGLAASRQRARLVRDMLADNVEFTPRRRQDVDAIFLLARSGSQARAIKPLLAFHYAGTLPVYANTGVYSGVPHPGDRDLNGVTLVETPWLLGGNQALRLALDAGERDNGAYTRLNALGADAHLLQSEFGRLQAGPDALLRGNTGLLTMNPDLQILRESLPATFDGGELVPR
jgi:outer membrane PBP1 activator LpoA protein